MIQQSFPIQTKMKNVIKQAPVEIFRWGAYPDHYKIEMPHAHNFDELLFFTEGGGVHEINFIEHEIEKYSIHFIPRSCVHFLRRSIHSDGFTLAFDSSFLERNAIHSFQNPIYSPGFKNQSFSIKLNKEKFQEKIQLIDYFDQMISLESGYYQKKCFLLTLELLLNSIAGDKNTNPILSKNCTNPICSSFMNLVKKHQYESVSVSWYAKRLYVSPSYLSNLVKSELGISPKQYIISSLLYSVKRQLYDTKMCIKLIAHNHGMDLTQLGKLFKKNVGFTMSQYRSKKMKN